MAGRGETVDERSGGRDDASNCTTHSAEGTGTAMPNTRQVHVLGSRSTVPRAGSLVHGVLLLGGNLEVGWGTDRGGWGKASARLVNTLVCTSSGWPQLTGICEAGRGAIAATTIVASALVARLVERGVDHFGTLLWWNALCTGQKRNLVVSIIFKQNLESAMSQSTAHGTCSA
jgi:hypothetical protein